MHTHQWDAHVYCTLLMVLCTCLSLWVCNFFFMCTAHSFLMSLSISKHKLLCCCCFSFISSYSSPLLFFYSMPYYQVTELVDDTFLCCWSQNKTEGRKMSWEAIAFPAQRGASGQFFFFFIPVRPAFCLTGSPFIYLMAKSGNHLCNPRGHTGRSDPVWDGARRGLHQGTCTSCRCLSISSLGEESSWQTWCRARRREEAKQIQRGACTRLRLWSFSQQRTITSSLISLHLTFSRSDMAK